MANFAINVVLFKNLQKGIGTDCSFVFKSEKRDAEGNHVNTEVIFAHRCVLSAASPFFEANLKATWKGDQPIEVKTVEYVVFLKILRGIYLSDVQPIANFPEALAFYEAAHFYQLDGVIELVRNEIIRYCTDRKVITLSKLVSVIVKHQDHRLLEFFRNYFVQHAQAIIKTDDFLDYPLEALNMLYQIDNLPVDEDDLLGALEKYVEKHGPESAVKVKPAIRGIRFGSLTTERIANTSLLSDEEKNVAQNQQSSPFLYLSRDAKGRNVPATPKLEYGIFGASQPAFLAQTFSSGQNRFTTDQFSYTLGSRQN